MSETNLLHYIQSWDFVDTLIEWWQYQSIYADVWHLFPNCSPLSEWNTTGDPATIIILSRLTVAQFLQMYDVADLSHITIINLRVWVAGIGHKFIPEFDDIRLMTWYGWTVYEPISLYDLNTVVSTIQQPTYLRITHRYVPSEIEMKQRDGLWYFGEMGQSMTLFPASMIEAVWLLDAEEQKSQYMLVSDWTNWYLSDYFREVASYGGSTVIVMEQSPQSAAEYIDVIQTLYPKHHILARTIGTDIREWDVIVDEYRDEWYGCDAIWLGRKL
jgi:hypothetical protein